MAQDRENAVLRLIGLLGRAGRGRAPLDRGDQLALLFSQPSRSPAMDDGRQRRDGEQDESLVRLEFRQKRVAQRVELDLAQQENPLDSPGPPPPSAGRPAPRYRYAQEYC